MKIVQRALTLTVCIAILAGCAGGGSKTAAVPQPLSSAAAAAAAAAAPKGTVTLTLRFPTNFHHARFPAPAPKAVMVKGKKTYRTAAATVPPKTTAAKAPGAAATVRKIPLYVNPTNGNIIYVSGYSQSFNYVQGGSGTLSQDTQQPDGSQMINATLPADYYYYIAVEEDDSNQNQLAYGTINAATINAGSQNQLTITMDMNAQYIVLTTDPVGGADATVLSTNLESPTQFCSYGTGPQPFYAFAADPTAGYVLPVLTGTPAGAAYDVNNAGIAIPAPTLNGPFSQLVVTPLGMQSRFTMSPSYQYASFVENNPDGNYGGQSYGYAEIGDQGSSPCTLTASFDNTMPDAYQPATMTIAGGNAPYTVTETDGPPAQCTLTEASTYTWTVVPQSSGIECDFTINDKNSGNSTTASLTSNDPQSNPLTVTPTSILLQNQTEMDTIQISGGTPPYMYTYSGDTSVWQVINPMATSFTIQAGPNYNASCQTMDVTDSNDGDVTFSAGNCSL